MESGKNPCDIDKKNNVHILTDDGNLTDESLCEMAKSGDDFAYDVLLKRYKTLVSTIARQYYLIGGGVEDLIQEGSIGFIKAVHSYSNEGKASFKTFANKCIRSSIYSTIKKYNTEKNKPLSDFISFNTALEDDEDKSVLIKDLTHNPEENYINQESVSEFLCSAKKILSKFEYKIFQLFFLTGYSYDDIEIQTGKTSKSIENAIQRIKKKLNEIRN